MNYDDNLYETEGVAVSKKNVEKTIIVERRWYRLTCSTHVLWYFQEYHH
jgi:hypothetical protein